MDFPGRISQDGQMHDGLDSRGSGYPHGTGAHVMHRQPQMPVLPVSARSEFQG